MANFRIASLARSSFLKKSAATAVPVKRTPDLESSSAILSNGLFGPATKGSLVPVAIKGANGTQTTGQGDIVLLGTAGTGNSGFILLRKISGNEERVFKIGEKVFDLGVLTAVKKESADIRTDSGLITLRTQVSPTEATNQKAVQPLSPVKQSLNVAPGIIDQRALNSALDNIGQAMTDARMLPAMKDGKVEGFRISEVKPGGLFASVGLKNGDLLVRINEFPLDSPEKATQSLMALKGQSRIKLDLVREGSPATMTYDIR